MNTTNYKGRLNEYCQKLDLPLPIFGLIHREGGSHNPSFLSYVQVDGVVYTGEDMKSRLKDSEQEAARVFFSIVQECNGEFVESKRPSNDLDYLCIETGDMCNYYIDLENCSNLDFSSFETPTRKVHKICSRGAVKSIRDECDIVVNCTRSDAADVAIIAKVTEDILRGSRDNIQYIIVSRDKLLHTFVEVAMELYGVDIKAVIP